MKDKTLCIRCGKIFEAFHVCESVINEQIQLIIEKEDKIILEKLTCPTLLEKE
jgi:hypothetical protein